MGLGNTLGIGLALLTFVGVGHVGPAFAADRSDASEAVTRSTTSGVVQPVARELPDSGKTTPTGSDLYSQTRIEIANSAYLSAAAKNELSAQLANEMDDFSHATVAGPHTLVHILDLPEELYFYPGIVSAYDAMESHYVDSPCDDAGECPFPIEHDLTTDHFVSVHFDFETDEAFENLKKYVAGEHGTALTVTINGVALNRADLPGLNTYNVHFLSWKNTMMINIGKDAWYPASPPWSTWHVAVQLWGELPPKLELANGAAQSASYGAMQVSGGTTMHSVEYVRSVDSGGDSFAAAESDPWGAMIDVSEDWLDLFELGPKLFAEQTAVVVPKPKIKNFFTSTIGTTVLSGRCTTCHLLDTQAKLNAQHGFSVPVEQVPSILVEGKKVNHCQNCHEGYLPTYFEERKWATPTPELDVNWLMIIAGDTSNWPRNICNRMVANMPDPETREKHFHEDARLFWAVESGVVPGGQKPTAQPKDYDVFIDRFDEWNEAGAPCPD